MQRIVLGLLAAVCFSLASPAWGETFLLDNGGRVEGDLLNPKESPRKRYVIKTTSGAQMTLEKNQVKEVVRHTPAETEYEKVRPQYPDTIEGQWELAEWCREHNLTRLRNRHLERIIELDPDHELARRGLGYRRVRGEWKTKKQEMEEQGYINYKGTWMTRQEQQIQEARRKSELAVKEWKGRLKRWRGWLENGRADEALQQIDGISDPYAIPALEELLVGKKQDKNESLRKRYVDALARIGTPSALQALCVISLKDESEEVRLTCLDYLEARPSLMWVDFFIRRLEDKNNDIVNRAGQGLARMKNATAIGPLIDHLITEHKFVVSPPGSMIQGGMVSGGGISGTGFNFGNQQPRVEVRQMENQDVLEALARLSGVNFGFDLLTWKKWYASTKKSKSLNARRDGE